MGTWYLSLAVSLFLVLIGIYIHWSVVLIGLMLPFVPMISFLLERRRKRAGKDPEQTAQGQDEYRPLR